MNEPRTRLLAIEQAPGALAGLQSTLEAAGYAVRCVPAEDAVATVRAWAPDLLLTDAGDAAASLVERLTQPVQPLPVVERRMIEAALRQTNNDVSRAAALLEVNASTIYRKLQAWRTSEA